MNKVISLIVQIFICLMTFFMAAVLLFVLYYIAHEALPLFREVSVSSFLLGERWMPVDYTGSTAFGIRNFILATVAVSVLAMLFSILVGLGAALWLACSATERMRSVLYPFIDLIAGIPSVVMGFIGLTVLVRLFMKIGIHTGSCVLAASLLLSIMLLPFLISSCADTIRKVSSRYLVPAQAMGVSKWYTITTIILPASLKNILMAMVLAIGRAMGETMAVMMVIGNTNLAPKLLGKSETIAAVIALEMGTAQADSLHYHALYAAGLVLMLVLFLINIGIHMLHSRLSDGEVFP